MAFGPGNPETQTVSRFFPKVCAPLQKKLWDQNHNHYQLGLKALLWPVLDGCWTLPVLC